MLEADGRLVMPGFIDAHSHAEGAVFDTGGVSWRSCAGQGVTSVMGGQDGVSYAPGDGAEPTDLPDLTCLADLTSLADITNLTDPTDLYLYMVNQVNYLPLTVTYRLPR